MCTVIDMVVKTTFHDIDPFNDINGDSSSFIKMTKSLEGIITWRGHEL